jgi:ABC-type multidrug transport system ATPase subunit
VDDMIKVLHLEDKYKTAAQKLSGGMKRKLSVGIALIAGSKVTIISNDNYDKRIQLHFVLLLNMFH